MTTQDNRQTNNLSRWEISGRDTLAELAKCDISQQNTHSVVDTGGERLKVKQWNEAALWFINWGLWTFTIA